MELFLIIFIIAVVVISVYLLKGFDKVAGRGPDQVKKGINESKLTKEDEDRISCPMCAEMIKKEAKVCRYCGHQIVELVESTEPKVKHKI